MYRSPGIVPLLLLCLAAPVAAQSPMAGMGGPSTTADTAQLAGVRRALDRYRDPFAAVRDGYLSTLACIDFPHGEPGAMGYRPGAMGVHFLNPSLVGPQLDPAHPQVLIYEPMGDSLHLVAAEWFVPTQVSATRPRIFGRELDGPMEGHAPIMPAELHHWDLHVWLWKSNPSGIYSPTNPDVHCPASPYTVRGGPPKIVSQ